MGNVYEVRLQREKVPVPYLIISMTTKQRGYSRNVKWLGALSTIQTARLRLIKAEIATARLTS